MAKVQPTKVTELYKGKIKVAFYEKSHRYLINETERPLSVTACTGIIDKSRPLIYWATGLMEDYLKNIKPGMITLDDIDEAKKQHTIRKEAAATSGSKVHEWAEQYIMHKLKRIKELPEMPTEEPVRLGVMAFLKWVDEHKIKFLDTELLVYSKKHKYVGLMDCKFTMGGSEKHKIVHAGDFKTSKAVYNEMRYQVSAYQEADVEESGEVYGSKWILRFDKLTGEFEAHEYGDHEKDFKVFLACLAIKTREKELSKY